MSLKTPEKIERLQQKLCEKAKKEPAFRFYQIYDKVYREDILAYAYRLARVNKGAPGVDGMTFADIERQGLEEWLAGLREELHDKTYKPSPVRRVMIPKPGGGERPLGIPTIRDRVAQTAVKLLLEPIFEADFVDEAYGYRPKRSAKDAVQEVHQAICQGYTDVVDADLSRYFDTIPHHELVKCLARRICDRHLLRLIKLWLKAPVEERDERGWRRMSGGKKSKRGTPQGGVISPLLANIYMHRYLRGWHQRKMGERFQAKIVNYADDFVILSRGKAREALAWTRWAMGKLNLSLNESKTCIRRACEEPFDFLGYTFGPEHHRRDGHWYLSAKPSKKSIQKFKGRIRTVLRTGNQQPWPEIAETLNRKLRGWSNYFSHGTRYMAYRAVDNYVSSSVRDFLQRRHKVPGRGTTRFSNEVIFGELRVLCLRRVHLGPPSTA